MPQCFWTANFRWPLTHSPQHFVLHLALNCFRYIDKCMLDVRSSVPDDLAVQCTINFPWFDPCSLCFAWHFPMKTCITNVAQKLSKREAFVQSWRYEGLFLTFRTKFLLMKLYGVNFIFTFNSNGRFYKNYFIWSLPIGLLLWNHRCIAFNMYSRSYVKWKWTGDVCLIWFNLYMCKWLLPPIHWCLRCKGLFWQ
jgi:hypothetical protein